MEITPLRDLQEKKKDVIVKVFVLRQGNEVLTKKGNMTIRKLIFIDEDGTMIHGLIFSNVNQYFCNLLQTNRCYTIYNPFIKCIDPTYANVNPKFDLILQRSTTVIELQKLQKMPHLTFEFTRFDELNNVVNGKDLHIVGVLMKVTPLSSFKREAKTNGHKREVVLVNTSWETVAIKMWDDLAIHEGRLMKRLEFEHPIVVFCNLNVQIYLNAQQLKTTPTTAVFLNPLCDASKTIKTWLTVDGKKNKLEELWVSKIIAAAKEVTLDEVANKRSTLIEDNYYLLSGTIHEIENKATPWYEACDHCFQAITKTTDKVSCFDCVNLPITIIPRYRICMTLEDGNEKARITLFDKVAESVIGIPVEDFIQFHNQNLPKNTCEDLLNELSSKAHTFLFKLDSFVQKRDNILEIIAESIKKPKDRLTTNVNIKKRRSRKISNLIEQVNVAPNVQKPDIPKINKDKQAQEIQDDETIADYNKRARTINKAKYRKICGGLKIKKEKM